MLPRSAQILFLIGTALAMLVKACQTLSLQATTVSTL